MVVQKTRVVNALSGFTKQHWQHCYRVGREARVDLLTAGKRTRSREQGALTVPAVALTRLRFNQRVFTDSSRHSRYVNLVHSSSDNSTFCGPTLRLFVLQGLYFQRALPISLSLSSQTDSTPSSTVSGRSVSRSS